VDSLLTVGGYDGVCNVTEDMRGDELFFETDCVGRPHLVKIPYFPNWRVEGAERIYLVSPALMMVIPEKAKVHIYYGVEFADTLGWVITFVGVIFLLYLLSGRIKFVKTRLHDKVSKWLEKWGFNGFFGFFEGRFSRHLVFCFSFVRANFLRVLAIVFAVAVLSAASFLFFSQSRCDGFCRQTDFEHGTYNLEDKVDYVRFGQNHADDMKSHKAGYDGAAVRDDFMYLQNGYLEFKTSVVPNTENILRLRMLDDISCRSGSLYVDGVFLARLRSSGSYSGWKDFPIKMKPEDSSDGKVTVRLTSDDPRCFGWDIMEAEVLVDECSCFSEQ